MATYLSDPAVEIERAAHAIQRYAAGDPLDRLPVSPAVLYAAIREHQQLREAWELARMARATYAAERALQVGDPAQLDEDDRYTDSRSGQSRIDPGAVAMRRLRVDTLWRYAQALAPRLYGSSVASADAQAAPRGGLIIESAAAALERARTVENAPGDPTAEPLEGAQ